MAKSTNAIVVGVGGHFIGDAVEFLNVAYPAIKKGFQTNDWSDLGEAVVQHGIAAVVSALLVTGSVIAVTAIVGLVSAPAAAIAGAFVAAGWAAYGLYDAVTNGVELINKISEDLADVIPKIGNTIEQVHEDVDQAFQLIQEVIEFTLSEEVTFPEFATAAPSLVGTYLVDTSDIALPDSIEGGDDDERFYGQNNAFIDAGAGNDEIFAWGSTTAIGGAGDDIVIGREAKFIPEGEVIDPSDPDSEVAETDLSLTLDGGEGDDWIISIGGEKSQDRRWRR